LSAILERREHTESKVKELKRLLANVETLVDGKACVYATGSFGRNEASRNSDLDVFIAGVTVKGVSHDDGSSKEKRALSHLDEILVTARLIEITRTLGLPDFDGDGEYLKHYTQTEIIGSLGRPEDDALNTFTARLLLLLESRPLLNNILYDDIIDSVIKAYWRDYEKHRNDFVPAFFVNDVQRLWRTFCVNYEARTRDSPAPEKAKRRVKNYKLKYSRLLTCYSPLLCLLFLFSKYGTVSPDDMRGIVKRTPIDRLTWLQSQAGPNKDVDELLHSYEEFLEVTNVSNSDLSVKLDNEEDRDILFGQAAKFGEIMHKAILKLGDDSKLARHLIV
jgi:predicted nucleotidyltransferase